MTAHPRKASLRSRGALEKTQRERRAAATVDMLTVLGMLCVYPFEILVFYGFFNMLLWRFTSFVHEVHEV